MISAALRQVEEAVLAFGEGAFWDRLAVHPKVPIVEWVQSHVDLHYDLTSAASGLIELYPYQLEPLSASEDPQVREVTLMWCPRLGKSTIWKLSLLKRLHDGGLSGLIVYPNQALANKTNKDTVLPLLRSLPNLKADLAAIGGKTKDSYHMPSARSILYFVGGVAQIVSYTANWGALDEMDQLKLENTGEKGKNIDQRRALKLRMLTFPQRMMIGCSSPTTPGGMVNVAWKEGSRGVWHLRCLGCGALSPANQLAFPRPDGTFAGLQWEKTAAGDVDEGSIRWVCPACGRAHSYSEAPAMSRAGEYVHQNPENRSHRTFQAGALSNPWLWPWLEIAQAQENAVDLEAKRALANNVKGVPYKHVREGDLSISIPDVLEGKKAPYPHDLAARLSVVCAGIDQQASQLAAQKYYVYAIRGWDEDGNSWQLASGVANSTGELDALMEQRWHGLPVALALIDQGGFGDNAQTTDPFVNRHPNVLYYKGGSDTTLALAGAPWKFSEGASGLVLVNAIHYQCKLLELLYGAPRKRGYAWTIPPTVPAAYLEQLASMQPNNRMKDGNGQAFPYWGPGNARHDYFDAEKMALAALDVACSAIPPARFRRGALPLFIRAEYLRAIVLAEQKKKHGGR